MFAPKIEFPSGYRNSRVGRIQQKLEHIGQSMGDKSRLATLGFTQGLKGGAVVELFLAGYHLQTFFLRPGEYLIGRGDTSDLQLGDMLVSRVHASLVVHSDGRIVLSDLESKNGLILLETLTKVSERQVGNQEEIIIGAHVLRFHHVIPVEAEEI